MTFQYVDNEDDDNKERENFPDVHKLSYFHVLEQWPHVGLQFTGCHSPDEIGACQRQFQAHLKKAFI